MIDGQMSETDRAKVLRTFMPDGRIKQMPVKWSKKTVILEEVAQAFEPGVRYPERAVNAILRAFWDDYVTLRRYLIDAKMLDRERGVYWRSGGRVDL
jgi:hypothetical protein